MGKKRRIGLIMFLFVATALSLVAPASADSGIPVVLDLTNAGDAPVSLEGQWAFYWEDLLEPADFKTDVQEPSGFVHLPGAWNGYRLNGEPLPGQGYATYRLLVRMDPNRITSFKIPRILTAYRMWVDGQEVAAAGVVGRTFAESRPQYLTQQAFVKPGQEQTDIVIQVSNFHHRSGGILEHILAGPEDHIMSVTKTRLAYELFLFGSLMMMGIYHLVLFRYRKNERSLLYFALYCLMIGARTLLVGEIFLTQMFPFFSWEVAHKLQTLSYYGAVLILILFFRNVFPANIHGSVVKGSQWVVGLFAAVVLLTPARVFTRINPAFQVFTLLVSLYFLFILVQICRQKKPGALYIAFGYGFLIITVFHDMLFHSILMSDNRFLVNLIRTGNLSSFGLLVFTVTHSFVLAMKYAHTFNENERITLDLMALNENLETLVEKRTEDLTASHQQIGMQKQALEKANRELELMSKKDGLTQVWNRRYFDEVLHHEWKRTMRFKQRLSLLFLDIDNFKDYNDQHGHQAGDRRLQQVAQTLQKQMKRSVDLVARYGGEEFVVLLTETDDHGTASMAETLRASVESLGVTVSIGVSSLVPSSQAVPEDLVLTADQAMYRAKRKGKNRVEHHMGLTGSSKQKP